MTIRNFKGCSFSEHPLIVFERRKMNSPVVLHIPHASTYMPSAQRNKIALSDDELQLELLRMTDRYTDELFIAKRACSLRFPLSRLVCDPERFRNDQDEPMSAKGMGAVYICGSNGQIIRRLTPEIRDNIIVRYYDSHHAALTKLTEAALWQYEKCIIIDCHSFSSVPLPYEDDQSPSRPDFCIGTDDFHTSPELARLCENHLSTLGYTVRFNSPYAGSIVPMRYFGKDKRVLSVMIEINRQLYMTDCGEKNSGFKKTKHTVEGLLLKILDFAK